MEEPERLATFRLETNILDGFKRILTLARRIAREIRDKKSVAEE